LGLPHGPGVRPPSANGHSALHPDSNRWTTVVNNSHISVDNSLLRRASYLPADHYELPDLSTSLWITFFLAPGPSALATNPWPFSRRRWACLRSTPARAITRAVLTLPPAWSSSLAAAL